MNESPMDLGRQAFGEGRWAEAESAFRAAVEVRADDAEALHGLGASLWMQGHPAQAREWVAKAVALQPEKADYLATLGEIDRQLGDFEGAIASLEKAFALAPASAGIQNNLGMVDLDRGRFHQAVVRFQRFAEMAPEDPLAWFNLGLALKELNYFDQAIAAYRRALELNPDFAEAHVNLAMCLLAEGQYPEGFAEYEWRLKPPFSTIGSFDGPLWDGLLDPTKTLLLVAEQGAGDILQFCRYIPFMAAQGVRVIVRAPMPLRDLVETVEGVSMAFGEDEELLDFDHWYPLASLPFLFGTRLDTVPGNIPYLFVPFSQRARWRNRLEDDLGDVIKVGLVWAGNPKNSKDSERSIPLAALAGLAGTAQVGFVSLSNQPPVDAEAAAALGLWDYSAELTDFLETAALVDNLDLVIGVDTAVLHLAGALGRPTWGLVKYSPHWPWGLDGQHTPWYADMLLFRQRRPGDWGPVLEEVAACLRQVMEEALIEPEGEGADA